MSEDLATRLAGVETTIQELRDAYRSLADLHDRTIAEFRAEIAALKAGNLGAPAVPAPVREVVTRPIAVAAQHRGLDPGSWDVHCRLEGRPFFGGLCYIARGFTSEIAAQTWIDQHAEAVRLKYVAAITQYGKEIAMTPMLSVVPVEPYEHL